MHKAKGKKKNLTDLLTLNQQLFELIVKILKEFCAMAFSGVSGENG